MDYFRALVATREKSARGLDLTELIIRFNPGHYSIWAYRAEILMKLRETEGDKVLETELDLLDELVKFHLKSYQVWLVFVLLSFRRNQSRLEACFLIALEARLTGNIVELLSWLSTILPEKLPSPLEHSHLIPKTITPGLIANGFSVTSLHPPPSSQTNGQENLDMRKSYLRRMLETTRRGITGSF